MTKAIRRLAVEIAILAAAIAVVAVVAYLVFPGDFPDATSSTYVADKQRFYNRMFIAPLFPLPAGIVTYFFLRKRYMR